MGLTRREFLRRAALGAGALSGLGRLTRAAMAAVPAPYLGPNVILIRFGGGARRQETIDPRGTYSPFLCHDFAKRGALFKNMEIGQLEGVDTSHGQGTLNLLTGIYDRYKDFEGAFMGERFESKVPTLFEYLRKAFDVPEYQTLIVNGEDRRQEEFYSFSSHPAFGQPYRASVLSLYRFKTYLLRRQLSVFDGPAKELENRRRELKSLEDLDYRVKGGQGQSAPIEALWERWRRYWGDSGFVNPRGDRLLTELALWGLRELRPKLMIVHYNDCDYVHWGNPMHYTRGIAVMDDGLRQIVSAVEADPEYRDNTLFVVAPDCGRDDNRLKAVPFQHHFNSRSAHEVFALFAGPGVAKDAVVGRAAQQIDVAPTIARMMGLSPEHAKGETLAEAFA